MKDVAFPRGIRVNTVRSVNSAFDAASSEEILFSIDRGLSKSLLETIPLATLLP